MSTHPDKESSTMPTTQTPFDRLRSKRQRIARQHERRLEIAIPGYGGELVARYHPLDWEVLSEVADRAETSEDTRAALYAAVTILARSCEAVLIRDDDDTLRPLQEVADDFGTAPVGLHDPRLAQALGIEPAADSQDAVLAVFGNELALMEHQNEVFAWMRGAETEVDRDF